MAPHDATGVIVDGDVVAGGPLVSIAALVAALRRGWRLCAGGAVLGMLAGLALSLVFSPPHTATAEVLLRHPSFLDPAQAMATDAQLVSTRSVAERAVERLDLRDPPTTFLGSYRASILTNDLLRISADAASAGEAVRRADAIAGAFLDFRAETFRRQRELALADLNVREGELETELEGVNAQIEGSSRETEAEVRALGELLLLRSTLAGQLADVRRRIDSTTAETDAIVQQSIVVDPATAQRRSVLRGTVVNVVPGVILGLFGVAGWLVLRELVVRPVRRRADVAAALGAPVEASVPAIRRRRWWWPWRRRPQVGEQDFEAAISHLRAAVAHSARSSPAVLVVALGDDDAAARVVAGAVEAMAADGETVLVVDATAELLLADLTLGGTGARESSPPDGRGGLLRATTADIADRPISFRKTMRRATCVITLATLDPAIGADHLVEVADTAVAVVGAGRVSATALISASDMLRVAGITLDSAILVGADRSDETVGLADDRRRERGTAAPIMQAR